MSQIRREGLEAAAEIQAMARNVECQRFGVRSLAVDEARRWF